MHAVDALGLEEGLDGHQYHNPLIKALSNSNLTMFDHPVSNNISANLIDTTGHSKNVHSAMNLLDLVDEDAKSISADSFRSLYSHQSSNSSQPSLPPRRPPPPPNSQTSTISVGSNSSTSRIVDPFDQVFSTNDFGQPPIIQVDSAKSLNGFDDDFGLVFTSSNNSAPSVNNDDPFSAISNRQVKPEPTRPPPLPPMTTAKQGTESTAANPPASSSNALFTLFDDDFGSMNPSEPAKPQQPPLPPMPATLPNRPPPLPPMPSSNMTTTSQAPPLPPLPNLPSSALTNSNSNSVPKLPPQPSQAPKLPPRPTTVPQQPGAILKPTMASPPKQTPPGNAKDTAFNDLLSNFNAKFSVEDKSQEVAKTNTAATSTAKPPPPPLPPRPSNFS